MRPTLVFALLVAAAVTVWQTGASTQAPATVGAAAGPAPWPDPATIDARRRESERRRLFREDTILEFTLTSEFKAIDRDRDPNSSRTFPGTVSFAQPDGTTVTKPVQVGGRGHSRRSPRLCDFIPLRLVFPRGELSGTVFGGQDVLKLGAHCRSNSTYEQYVIREYTAYRIFNLLTPMSFRVRLARGTYIESTNGKVVATRLGMFIEDDDDVARRLGGRILDSKGLRFRHIDWDYLTLVALFEYLLGNTDVSIYGLHNVRIVERPDSKRFAVPYDFDYSGLVDTTYAVVDKRLFDITSVRERVYRGPCRTLEELTPFFDQFNRVKPDIWALYDNQPEFNKGSRSSAKSFIEDFYEVISSPRLARRAFVDGCVKAGMM